jgi:hypothetical protein
MEMQRFILGFVLAAGLAGAQTTVIVQPDPYAQAFADKVRQNDQDLRNAGARLGNLIAPKLVQVQATMACGNGFTSPPITRTAQYRTKTSLRMTKTSRS